MGSYTMRYKILTTLYNIYNKLLTEGEKKNENKYLLINDQSEAFLVTRFYRNRCTFREKLPRIINQLIKIPTRKTILGSTVSK